MICERKEMKKKKEKETQWKETERRERETSLRKKMNLAQKDEESEVGTEKSCLKKEVIIV